MSFPSTIADTVIVEETATSTARSSDASTSEPDACLKAVALSNQESGCSLWWRRGRFLGDKRVGILGQYRGGDGETAQALLTDACGKLREQGCNLVVGPMDADTWSDYRFVTEFGCEPRFWLEPTNPPEWPQQFVRHGFQPLAHYFSAINEDLAYREPGLNEVASGLRAAGMRIRPVSPASFDEDVLRIFDVARIAFRSNLMYSEPLAHKFVQRTQPLRNFAAAELSWIAEQDGATVGFLFGVPDMLEEARLGRCNTVIIKTLAVLPSRAYAGLGQLLLAHVQQHALASGYARAIHALMRDVGSMQRLSGRYARRIRRYTLFAKALAP
jgi:GNAT superfamily N-acetyltransferase